MLTQTSLYALRALAYIVRSPERGTHPRSLHWRGDRRARKLPLEDPPRPWRRGIPRRPGAGKTVGYRLARDPADIRVHDVVALFQNVAQFRRCVLGRPACSDANPCSIHDRWKPVADRMFGFLEGTTLDELKADLLPA